MYELRDVFTAWYQQSIGELGNIEVDVPKIEAIPYLDRQDSIELSKVQNESGYRIDLCFNRHVTRVAVAVIALARAETEDLGVTLITPLGTAISMRRGE